MVEFANPADHIAATNAAIVQATTIISKLREAAAEWSWLIQNKTAAELAATDEQRYRHLRLTIDEAKEMAALDRARWSLIREKNEPVFNNPDLHKEFANRQTGFPGLMESLAADCDKLKTLMRSIDAGGKWDFLPLDQFWDDRSDESLAKPIECVQDAIAKATDEKGQILSGKIASWQDTRPRNLTPPRDTDKIIRKAIEDLRAEGKTDAEITRDILMTRTGLNANKVSRSQPWRAHANLKKTARTKGRPPSSSSPSNVDEAIKNGDFDSVQIFQEKELKSRH